MQHKLTLLLLLLATAAVTRAQLPRVYDETRNPVAQLDSAISVARARSQHVLVQLGGNWCPWCLRFAAFAKADTLVRQAIRESYVYTHINYIPPRRAAAVASSATAPAGQVSPELTATILRRLGNPTRFGFPVFIVLDATGRVLHIQDSSFLEQGQGYDPSRTLRFLNAWTPAAVAGTSN